MSGSTYPANSPSPPISLPVNPTPPPIPPQVPSSIVRCGIAGPAAPQSAILAPPTAFCGLLDSVQLSGYQLSGYQPSTCPPGHAHADFGGNVQAGDFNVPMGVAVEILSYLPLTDVLTFILLVCKSFRHLRSVPGVWARMALESGSSDSTAFGGKDFVQLLREIPESSIRNLSLDTSRCSAKTVSDIILTIVQRLQFRISTLHLSGRALTAPLVASFLRRVWADNISTFSLINTAIGANILINNILPHMRGVLKLRIEGGQWTLQRLQTLSAATSRSNASCMNNRLTHLSIVGDDTKVYWENLQAFGGLFPLMEELFVSCVFADEVQWGRRYGSSKSNDALSPPALALQTRGQRRIALPSHADGSALSWIRMPKLRYFGCNHIGDPAAKQSVKTYEDIHSSFIWSLLVSHAATLERLELDRGAESTMNKRGFRGFPTSKGVKSAYPELVSEQMTINGLALPALQYLLLGRFSISWNWLTGGPLPRSEPSGGVRPPALLNNRCVPGISLPALRTIILWFCDGVPTHPQNRWISDLRTAYGPHLVALDQRSSRDVKMGNRGPGHW